MSSLEQTKNGSSVQSIFSGRKTCNFIAPYLSNRQFYLGLYISVEFFVRFITNVCDLRYLLLKEISRSGYRRRSRSKSHPRLRVPGHC